MPPHESLVVLQCASLKIKAKQFSVFTKMPAGWESGAPLCDSEILGNQHPVKCLCLEPNDTSSGTSFSSCGLIGNFFKMEFMSFISLHSYLFFLPITLLIKCSYTCIRKTRLINNKNLELHFSNPRYPFMLALQRYQSIELMYIYTVSSPAKLCYDVCDQRRRCRAHKCPRICHQNF